MPTISKKIHDENQSADFKINFKGLGIGNGAIDPPNAFEYGEYLYQVNGRAAQDNTVVPLAAIAHVSALFLLPQNGLVDGKRRDRMLGMEDLIKQQIEQELWSEAWLVCITVQKSI